MVSTDSTSLESEFENAVTKALEIGSDLIADISSLLFAPASCTIVTTWRPL
jgi:hypothetical protein